MSTNTSSTDDALKQYGVDTPPSELNPRAGVDLNNQQKLLLCSILDLFAGRPSKRKLTLWADDGSFHDPLTNTVGRKQYEAQWYGLKAAFSSIERLGCEVTSAGEPMEMKLKTKYVVKGVGSGQEIDSVVVVGTEGGKVKRLEDRWDGEIKEGPVKKALRALNAVSVPAMVSVPNSVEEEEAGK